MASIKALETALKLEGYEIPLRWFRLYKSNSGYRWAVRHWYFPFWHWADSECFIHGAGYHRYSGKDSAIRALHVQLQELKGNKWRPTEVIPSSITGTQPD